MKRYLLIPACLSAWLGFLSQGLLWAQTPVQLIEKAQRAAQEIKSGYYEVTQLVLPFSETDTMRISNRIYFKPSGQSAYPTLFSVFQENELVSFFSGSSFFLFNGDTAIQFTQAGSPNDFAYNVSHYGAYKPISEGCLIPFKRDAVKLKKRQKLELLADENINGQLCYHLRLSEIPKLRRKESRQIQLVEWHYWIQKSDFLPVKFSEKFVLKEDGVLTNQYMSYALTKLERNPPELYSKLDENAVLQGKFVKTHVPKNRPELLSIGTRAPDWSLPMTINEPISLADLKGDLVLMDFYFMSCIPCRKTVPVLNNLQEKYGKQGLRVIGVNPVDTNIATLEQFFEDKQFKYPTVLHAQKTAEDYHVYGYPTLYLIDRKGNIVFVSNGFGEDLEKELEEVIEKELKIEN